MWYIKKYYTVKKFHSKLRIKQNNLGFGNGFSDMTPKAPATKENIKWASSKLKLLCLKGYYQDS